ncbi:uncharacterized protein LOC111718156 [Eurytemora carolleeae]|uniref:uncharacterized protein LOC111718156 n=1 Tax=Eurytemora carolleeae TaxID=1294199 RepID=UPI000C78119A|nr:uncharacterized protein LOC111718156 [Eurytemora carolleeae]|eukprot:XP_023349439.1 uncharacterized protein LOC111718156 [Eurytemora affinis]
MALLSSTLLGGINLSTAEKAFRPWWDNIEDHIVYTLVILSILVAPNSFISPVRIDCTCTSDCDKATGTSLYFIGQYCAQNVVGLDEYYWMDGLQISIFAAYFPYFLLLLSAALVIIDRPFVMILFQSYNIEQIYSLLVTHDPFTDNLDRKKETNELLSCLGSISSYFTSYLIRTLFSIVFSLIPLIIYIWYLVEDYSFDQDYHKCRFNIAEYSCAGYPMGLYKGVGYLYVSLLSIYLILNLWNLIWVLFPSINSIDKIMIKFKAMHVSSNLDKIYFKNRNVKLLMGLLSSTSGVGYSLRSMGLMDKSMNDALVPSVQMYPVSEKQSYVPSTVLRFQIVPNTPLDEVVESTRCYVSYSIEYGDKSVKFSKTIRLIV